MGVFVYLCVDLSMWMCLCGCVCVCVYLRKKKMRVVLHTEKRERKMSEINKIIVYIVTVTVYICSTTIANV